MQPSYFIPVDYPVTPRVRPAPNEPIHPDLLNRLDKHRDDYATILRDCLTYVPQFIRIPLIHTG